MSVQLFLKGAISLLVTVVIGVNLLLTREVRALRAATRLGTNITASRFLPAVSGVDEGGRMIDRAIEPGKHYLLIGFSPACQYCQKSVDAWKRLSGGLDKGKWVTIWVSKDSMDETRAFVRAHSITDQVLSDVPHRTYVAMGLGEVPQTIVVEDGGTRVRQVAGEVAGSKLSEIEALLVGAPDKRP